MGKGQRARIFHTVVVMGVAMTGLACERGGAPARGDDPARQKPTESQPPSPVIAEESSATSPSAAANAEPTTDAGAESTGGVASETGDPPDPGGHAKKRPRKRRAQRGGCPEGSELPDPPCFYIL